MPTGTETLLSRGSVRVRRSQKAAVGRARGEALCYSGCFLFKLL